MIFANRCKYTAMGLAFSSHSWGMFEFWVYIVVVCIRQLMIWNCKINFNKHKHNHSIEKLHENMR